MNDVQAAREHLEAVVKKWTPKSTLDEPFELRLIRALIRCHDHATKLEKALDPDMLDSIASEIQEFHHTARSDSLRSIARAQREALRA